jgi:hypothetical protein
MGLSRPSAWAQLEAENVPLDDVLGVSGIEPARAAGAVLSALGVAGESAPIEGSLVFSAKRGFRAGAFATARRAVADITNALPALSPEAGTLTPVATLDSLTGRHVVAQQQLRGFNVVGSRVTVHLDGGGAYALTGNPIGDLDARDPGPRPDRSEAEIRERVGQVFTVADVSSVKVKQVVFPVEGACVWAWYAQVPVDEPRADVRVFLRADDLEVLVSYVTTVAALFGEGLVYPVNPLRTPEPKVTLMRGIGPEPTDMLGGTAIRVGRRAGSPLTEPSRNWQIAPGSEGFDHVAAYHHVTEAYWYFARLVHGGLFDAAPFTPLNIFVNDEQNSDNAFFYPDRGELALGDFGDRPSARSADMVFHEFCHAVTHGIARLADTNQQQARALGEGYSDYFACSALGDPRFGDYVTDTPEGARSCARQMPKFQSDRDAAEEHELGEVWANVLWGIREELGPALADILAMESVYYLQPTPTLDRAHWALNEVDRVLFPRDETTGRHAGLIDQEWSERL